MNIGNIILSAGGVMRSEREAEDARARSEYLRREVRHGIERMDNESALMPGRRESELLRQQIERNELEFKQRSQPADLQHRAAMQPGRQQLEQAEQLGQLHRAREKQLATWWALQQSGDPQALELLNQSQMVAPGRRFSRIDRKNVPALGENGQPAVGADGQPVMQDVVRFAAADGKGDMFVPAQALNQLVKKHLSSTEKVGNSLVRKNPDGSVTPMYEPPRQTAVNVGGAVAVNGKITDVNTAGVEAKSEAELKKIEAQGALKRSLAEFRSRNGVQKATALERNMNMLVETGVAADHDEAYRKLRTGMGKSPEDQTLSLATNLMKGSAYRGKDGASRAFQDAARMVGEMRGTRGGDAGADAGVPAPRPGGSTPYTRKYTVQGKTFSDADINATAKKYGITPDQVKQRLGIR